MNYIAQYNSINFSKIPKEISVEFQGIYENTKGFTQHVNLEAQNFEDLYDLIQSMPGAIKKDRKGTAKTVIKQANQLRSKKSARLSASKKIFQKRKDLVTSKTAVKPAFKVGKTLMHRDNKKVTISSFDWVDSRKTYSYTYKSPTGIGNDDEASFSTIVTKSTEKKTGQKYKVGDYVKVRTGNSSKDYSCHITAYFPEFNSYEVKVAEDGGKKLGILVNAQYIFKANKEAYEKQLRKKTPETTPNRAIPAAKKNATKITRATSEKASASGTKKAAAKPKMAALAKESKRDLVLKKKIEDLKLLVNANRERVKENAQFKDKIATELRKYLKDNRVINGMSGLSDEYAKLKVQDRFYSNLLRGDNVDFLIIAKRLGIVHRKGSIKVSNKTRNAVGMRGITVKKTTKSENKK
ncbi:hypothetical protein [Emticicia sp. BO119]|uniref:hypothetical protein n=1 Tax=Emticicia sp. BO119 TaxID=2757768 RepID=UPI0015EFE2CE|nr:hypothetical protein [Emticicia sp. BO119]MBA4849048.1 hypothetical protein [Emticicia sp. BO119]